MPLVIAATDDERAAGRQHFGGRVMMTAAHHQSGTERLAEVVEYLALAEDEIVVNVQGDEPFIPPEIIRQVADNLANQRQAPMATLSVPIDEDEDIFNPNVVKVVRDAAGYALYFSRAAIPWDRDNFNAQRTNAVIRSDVYHRHIGLYAYRAGFVRRYVDCRYRRWSNWNH